MSSSNASLSAFNAYYRKNQRTADRQTLQQLINAFVAANVTASTSPNLKRVSDFDDWGTLISMLNNKSLGSHASLIESILKAFKILLRKDINRKNMTDRDVKAIVGTMKSYLHTTDSPGILMEGANAILNMCYEKENVLFVVDHGGVEILVQGLKTGSPETVQASCAGALQSVS